MRIYLDTCVYCRPYDDQSQKRIAVETEAFAAILGSDFTILGSEVLEDEVKGIESRDARIELKGFLNVCKERVTLSARLLYNLR